MKGGDVVASRMSIAAAAAVMASGLIVGGSSASLAFAEPEKPSTGEGPGASPGSPGSPTDPPAGQPAGPSSEAPAPGSGTGGTATPGGSSGGPQQPRTQIGNGRTGLESGNTDPTTDPTPPSKQDEQISGTAPQTTSPAPGELAPTVPGDPADAGEGEEPLPPESPETPETPAAGPAESGTGGGADERGSAAAEAPGEGPVDGSEEGTEEENGTGEDEGTEEGTSIVDPAGIKEEGEGEEEENPQYPDWCWWPLPEFPFPTLPTGGSGGGVPAPQNTIGQFLQIPQMQIPQLEQLQQLQIPQLQLPLPLPSELVAQLTEPLQPFIDAVTGLATAAAELPFAPITMPVIVAPVGTPGAGGGGGGGAGAGTAGSGRSGVVPRPGMPESPRVTGKPGGKPASPPAPAENTQNAPVFAAGAGAAPAPSYRAGYTDYLRAAGLGEVAAVAVPGVTGILALVGAGGLLGYRQARAGHTVRASGTGRFMS